MCEEIAPRGCVEVEWPLPGGGSATVLFARTGYTGEDGMECILPSDAGGALWDALLAAGVRPAGLAARDTLRLEAALPLHGHDIDESTDPFEAGLGFAVTVDDEAPFTGRAALELAHAVAPVRRLACIRLLERGVLAEDPSRAITRSRQPGRCCDSGCTVPGQAVMVPLPTPGHTAS